MMPCAVPIALFVVHAPVAPSFEAGRGTAGQMRHRPDIDGVRALAIALVVGYHAFPNRVPGGFVGVDVFFVISGFLITGLILNDRQLERFSLVKFYARRIRRIFPALILVLAASFVLGWMLLAPPEFTSLTRNVAGGPAFAVNFTLFQEAGYFDSAAVYKGGARYRAHGCSAAFRDHNSSVPGWRALLPTFGTYLLISSRTSLVNDKGLSNRGLVWLGLISYPLYLWHWPLLTFARITESGNPSRPLIFLCVIVSVVLAWLTYVFVEGPIRFGRPTVFKVASLIGLMATLGSIAFITISAETFGVSTLHARRHDPRDISLAKVDMQKEWRLGTCMLGNVHDR